jgi:hypothetical protein
MDKIPKEQFDALMRFADFESKQFDGREDAYLLMAHLAWLLWVERNQARASSILLATSKMLDRRNRESRKH